MGYVGSSRRCEDRWAQHKHSAKRGDIYALAQAIREYGWNHFSLQMLQLCTPEELLPAEEAWVERKGTRAPHGYNVGALSGGSSAGNYIREAIWRERRKDIAVDEEYRAGKRRNALAGWNAHKADPAFLEKRKLSAITFKVKMTTDPAFAAKVRENRSRAATIGNKRRIQNHA